MGEDLTARRSGQGWGAERYSENWGAFSFLVHLANRAKAIVGRTNDVGTAERSHEAGGRGAEIEVDGLTSVRQGLMTNTAITVTKGGVFLATGSLSIFSDFMHSCADVGNYAYRSRPPQSSSLLGYLASPSRVPPTLQRPSKSLLSVHCRKPHHCLSALTDLSLFACLGTPCMKPQVHDDRGDEPAGRARALSAPASPLPCMSLCIGPCVACPLPQPYHFLLPFPSLRWI